MSIKAKVDRYAVVKAQIKILEAEAADLGEEIKDWMAGTAIFTLSGDQYTIKWSQTERTMMQPMSWFKQHYDQDWIDQHTKTVEVNTLRVQAKAEIIAA